MYKKIVVALALDHGIGHASIEAARKLLDDGGQIIAVHICEPIPSSTSAMVSEDILQAGFQKAGERLSERVADSADIETVLLRGNPGRTISEYSKEIDADCIVIGSHNPGLSDFFLGSTAARVVRYANCSVLVVR